MFGGMAKQEMVGVEAVRTVEHPDAIDPPFGFFENARKRTVRAFLFTNGGIQPSHRVSRILKTSEVDPYMI